MGHVFGLFANVILEQVFTSILALFCSLTDQERSNVIFDNASVTEMSLRVNGKQHPAEAYTCDFTTAGSEDHSRVYMALMAYMNKAYNFDTGGIINYASFAVPISYFHV